MSSYVWISLTGDSVWSLFTFAVIVGLASSSLDILLALFVSDIFGMIALGTSIGFVNSILQLGGATGPVISGLIFDSTGSYHSSFVLCTIASAIAITILTLLKPIKLANTLADG